MSEGRYTGIGTQTRKIGNSITIVEIFEKLSADQAGLLVGDQIIEIDGRTTEGKSEEDVLMTVLNLTPRTFDYKIGIEEGTKWKVILNSDAEKFGGSGIEAEIKWYEETGWNNKSNSMIITLPPLSGLILKQTEKKLLKKTDVEKFEKK